MRNVIARQRSGVDDIEKGGGSLREGSPAGLDRLGARSAGVGGRDLGHRCRSRQPRRRHRGRAVGAAAEGLLEDGLATAIEDGLKHPVEKALEAMPRGGASNAGATNRRPETRRRPDRLLLASRRRTHGRDRQFQHAAAAPSAVVSSIASELSSGGDRRAQNAIVAMIRRWAVTWRSPARQRQPPRSTSPIAHARRSVPSSCRRMAGR